MIHRPLIAAFSVRSGWTVYGPGSPPRCLRPMDRPGPAALEDAGAVCDEARRIAANEGVRADCRVVTLDSGFFSVARTPAADLPRFGRNRAAAWAVEPLLPENAEACETRVLPGGSHPLVMSIEQRLLDSLRRCFEAAGLEVEHFVPATLLAAPADEGVVLIDHDLGCDLLSIKRSGPDGWWFLPGRFDANARRPDLADSLAGTSPTRISADRAWIAASDRVHHRSYIRKIGFPGTPPRTRAAERWPGRLFSLAACLLVAAGACMILAAREEATARSARTALRKTWTERRPGSSPPTTAFGMRTRLESEARVRTERTDALARLRTMLTALDHEEPRTIERIEIDAAGIRLAGTAPDHAAATRIGASLDRLAFGPARTEAMPTGGVRFELRADPHERRRRRP